MRRGRWGQRAYGESRAGAFGFTIPEILVVLTLASVLAFSLLVNVRSSSDRLKSGGLARALTEELRAARALAQQEQSEVLLVFPSRAGGATCRSFEIFMGDDKLRSFRRLNFDQQYESFIFCGTWPTDGEWDPEPTLDVSDDRYAEFVGQNLLLFGPDGSILTTLPRLDGAVCFMIDNALSFASGQGNSGSLSAVQNPHSVVVFPSGSVRGFDGLYRGGTSLPITDAKPELASLSNRAPVAAQPPSVEEVRFSPSRSSNSSSAGMGKTYIEIHPLSDSTREKDYGLATLTVEASDPDGGPLFLQVAVVASEGAPGTLASEGPVRMEFLNGRWVGTVGWRPPADASPEVAYRFDVKVVDKEGLSAEVASDATVLPVLETLTDNRLAIASSDGKVYLANLEGGELVEITPEESYEEQPIWSGDGTKLYVLARDGAGYVFVRYNADGTDRKVVSKFPSDAQGFEIDPSGMYLKYLHGRSSQTVTVHGTDGPTERTVTTYTLSALHVSNGDRPSVIASGASSAGVWLPHVRGAFQYSVPSIGSEEGPAYDADGEVIEGETTTYATVSSSIQYGRLRGLGPEVERMSLENPRSVEGAAFNPFDTSYCALPVGGEIPKLELVRNGGSLGVWNFEALLSSGKQIAERPSWSANGQWICYLEKEGQTSVKLRVQQVSIPAPDAPIGALAEVGEPFVLNVPSRINLPVPTPDGRNVLFIQGTAGSDQSKLMRVATHGGASPEQIGTDLEGVASFAITY